MRVDSVRLRRRSDRLWLLGAALLALLLLANAWRVPISEKLLPDPGLNRKLEDAQAALTRGELTRADGRGARELFESVLATDPDRAEARRGLEAVRDAALARAGQALDDRRLADATRDLQLARALSAPLVELQPLQSRLSKLEEASVDVEGLLARASAPDVGDEEALSLLDQVLALDPSNALALEARRELFAAWLLESEQLLDAGQVQRARATIERVLAEDPAHVDLPPLRARLAEIDAARPQGAHGGADEAVAHPALAPEQRANQRRGRECFAQAMATGKLRRAEDCLGRWMAPDPGAEGVAEARRQLAERWLAYADERIGASDWEEAAQALAAAGRWQPDHAQLPAARARLARARGGAR
jgi:tetratricopeptide (TPR) repeat protein